MAQVIPFAAPEYTLDQFIAKEGLSAKNQHIAHAFAHSMRIADKQTTVKRTRSAWAQMFNDWLTKPRY